MLISVLGIIMVVVMVGIIAYMAIDALSHGIISNVEHGTHYDKLSSLKSNYESLQTKLNNKKSDSGASQNYINAVSALNVAKVTIDDFESGIYSNKDNAKLDKLTKTAEEKLNIASDRINKL
jgi:hypothetical protein